MILTASADEPEPLGRLGLTLDVLVTALQAGERERRTCTRFDARSAPGYLMWTRTVRNLRETLTVAGWRAVDLNQLPLVVNADRTVGVAVSSGDAVTGLRLPGLQPKTRYTKGAMTAAAVERNGQLALFAVTPEPGSFANMATYVLLWHRDGRQRELRSELSRPASLGDGGRIDCWDRRILLPPIPLGDEVEIRDDDDPGEVDVYFEPRE